MLNNITMDGYLQQRQVYNNSNFTTTPQIMQSNPQNVQQQPVSEENKKTEDKKFTKKEKAAIVTAALALATASVCLYSAHKNGKLAKTLQQNLTDTQNQLTKAQGDLSNIQKALDKAKNDLTALQGKHTTTQNELTVAKNAIADLEKKKQKMIQNLLFPNGVENIEIVQSNVGDCYFLSTLWGFSRNKKGQDVIKNMVTINDDGNFVVKLDGVMKEYIVSPSELKGQRLSSGKTRRSAYSDMGVQAIERGYGKYRKELAKQMASGYSMMIIDGGFPSDVMKSVAGLNTKNFGNYASGAFDKQGKDVKAVLDSIARDMDHKIVCVATPPPRYGAVQKNGHAWMDAGHKFPCAHAYTIAGVDKAAKTVTVVNPHDTVAKQHKLTYDEFAKIFGEIFEGRI